MLLTIHIAAGGLAIVLGAVALLVKKGETIHRRSGLLFVYSMLVLGTTAALLGFRKSPTDGNVFGGLMTVYFVVTALTTVRPVSSWTRCSNVCFAEPLQKHYLGHRWHACNRHDAFKHQRSWLRPLYIFAG